MELSGEISREYERRDQIHTQIAARLYQTSKLSGFTGSLDVGKRSGRDPSLNINIPPPLWYRILHPETHENSGSMRNDFGDRNDSDDDIEDDSEIMVQLVDTLSI